MSVGFCGTARRVCYHLTVPRTQLPLRRAQSRRGARNAGGVRDRQGVPGGGRGLLHLRRAAYGQPCLRQVRLQDPTTSAKVA